MGVNTACIIGVRRIGERVRHNAHDAGSQVSNASESVLK